MEQDRIERLAEAIEEQSKAIKQLANACGMMCQMLAEQFAEDEETASGFNDLSQRPQEPTDDEETHL